MQSGQGCKGRIDVSYGARVQDMESQPQRAGRCLQISRLNIAPGKSRVDERGYSPRLGEQLVQQLQSLPTQFRVQRCHSGEVAARSVQAGNETDLNRIGASDEDNGNRGGCSPGCYRRLAVRGNHGHPAANQIGRQRGQTIVVTFRPAIFDRHGLALDIPGLAQALAKRGQKVCILAGRPGVEEAYHWRRRLLRARRERPCNRAAEKRDELAPPHVGHRAYSRLGAARRSTARSTCRRRPGKSLGQP